nr:DUF6638 family protein [uncultured Gellertiella sp.]
MTRRLQSDLIHGRLLSIDEPHLVARYNKALKGFGLPETGLSSFRIDMLGFSPEVAKALGDEDYLDPLKVNRRFIILTPEQENLPVAHSSFSNTAALMHRFYAANARALNAVTIKDAVYGEIEDSVAKVESLDDLLGINEIRFGVLSADDLLGKAAELRQLVDQLMADTGLWRDDAALNRMVELARVTGDIRQNPLVPDQLVFRHEAFWANHFGGVYVFLDEDTTTVICDPSAPGFRRSRPWQVSYIAASDQKQIFDFLARTGRIELPRGSWAGESGLIEHRRQMVLEQLAARLAPDADLDGVDAVWWQTFLQRNAAEVTREGTWPFLSDMLRQLRERGEVRLDTLPARERFLLVRALPGHRDAWLTNRLIAAQIPEDYLSRFMFDRQGFFPAYEQYRDNFRNHVVSVLTRSYLSDKRAILKTLYAMGDDDHA